MTYRNILTDLPDKWENKKQDLCVLKFPISFNVQANIKAVTCVLKSISNGQITLTLNEQITIVEQTITIPLPPEQTKSKADSYIYEIDFLNENNETLFSMRGKVKILAEINPS